MLKALHGEHLMQILSLSPHRGIHQLGRCVWTAAGHSAPVAAKRAVKKTFRGFAWTDDYRSGTLLAAAFCCCTLSYFGAASLSILSCAVARFSAFFLQLDAGRS